MKTKEYVLHLLGEISNFVLECHPSRMVISLHQEADGLHLCVMDDCNRSDEELAAMIAALDASERPELAEYYGSMGGTDLVGEARLNLIGWQVKHAEVTRAEGGTKIDLWLGGERFDPTQFNIPQKEDGCPPTPEK
ncbi:MAG: hypothetical protein R6V12_16765 [Candidatus Hydrogenedentota bacterium]